MTQGNNRCRSWWYWVKSSGYGGVALGSSLLLLPYLVTPQVNAYPLHKLAQASTDSGRATANTQNLPRLELGKPIERQLAGNEVHSYQMSVQAGQYLHVVVQQRGINVVVTLFGPDAKPLARSDSPNDDQEVEPVSLIAQTSGSYVLEVRPLSDSTAWGRYEVKIEELRLATEQDRLRVAAERAFMEASQLYIQEADVDRKIDVVLEQFENSLLEESFLQSLEQLAVEANERSPFNPEQVSSQPRQAPIQQESELSQQRALTKYQEALQLYRTLGDRFREADTLKGICHVYRNLAWAKEALDYCNQARQVYRLVDERSGEANTLQTIGRVYLLSDLDDKQKALSYFNQALQVYQRLSDSQGASFASGKGQADTLELMHVVYSRDLGDVQKQLEVSQQLLQVYRAMGDRSKEADTLADIGTISEPQKAIEPYNQALQIYQAIGDRSKEASTLESIGQVYSRLGKYQTALDYFNQLLQLRRTLGDRDKEVYTLALIGRFYSNLGDYEKTLDYLNQGLQIYRVVGDRNKEANILWYIGTVYEYYLRDYQKAIDSYAQVLQNYRVLGDNIEEDSDPLTGYGIIARKEDSILLAIVRNYKKLGNYQKALDYSNQILQLAGGDRLAQADALNNIGNLCLDICSNLSEYRSAIQAYNQALQLFHHASDALAWNGEMMVLANLGRLYQNQLNDYQKALDYYDRALKISQSKSGSWSFWHFVALSGIGTIYRDLGDYEKALNYFNQALKFSPRDPGIFFEAASLERERGNLNAALRHIEVALKDREKLSQRVMERDVSGSVYERSTTQQERTSYLTQTYKYYELYIDVLMQLHKTNPSQGYGIKALEVSERSRARLLVELLSEAGAEIRKGIDPLLLSSERTLLEQLSNKATRQTELLSTQHTQEQATALNQEIESLIQQYQALQAKIRQNSPQYAALTQPQPLTLDKIQQQVLDDDSLLLEYSLGEERSYLWAVTKTGISSYELPKRADIEAAAKRFYEQTGKQNLPQRRGLGAEPRIDTAEVTAQLTQMLLSPVASVLGQKRLLIVSDGVLQYLPFAALPAPDTLGKGNNPVPLIVKHEIVNLPSASTLAVIRQDTKGRKVAPLTVAVLADPVFSAKDERVKTSVGAVASLPLQPANQVNTLALNRAARDLGATFDRLPYTRTEAQSILKLASAPDAMPAFDFAASFATATSPQLSQYRIVHFATHGLLDSVHPELSGVVLSLVDEQGKPLNGFLRLQDIFNLNLPAELVVLSACETGLGQDVKGEGLVGLTRGFMYAGSPRVLVSLWSVNDRATAELMSRFYKLMLQEKLQPAAALRAAQIEMLHNPQWKSPYYWAAFTLQGEWR